jgi:hypothetical protein
VVVYGLLMNGQLLVVKDRYCGGFGFGPFCIVVMLYYKDMKTVHTLQRNMVHVNTAAGWSLNSCAARHPAEHVTHLLRCHWTVLVLHMCTFRRFGHDSPDYYKVLQPVN